MEDNKVVNANEDIYEECDYDSPEDVIDFGDEGSDKCDDISEQEMQATTEDNNGEVDFIKFEDSPQEEEGQAEVKPEDIVEVQFPEYFFSRLSGDMVVTCTYDDGSSDEKTIKEIYEREDHRARVYAFDKTALAMVLSDIEIAEPEKINNLYKLSLSSGLELVVSGNTLVLMCNNVWAPVNRLEIGDLMYSINFIHIASQDDNESNDEEGKPSFATIPTITRIDNIEFIGEGMAYGFISTYSNILFSSVMNENEIAFISVQQ